MVEGARGRGKCVLVVDRKQSKKSERGAPKDMPSVTHFLQLDPHLEFPSRTVPPAEEQGCDT
jgi:hypothetical protein